MESLESPLKYGLLSFVSYSAISLINLYLQHRNEHPKLFKWRKKTYPNRGFAVKNGFFFLGGGLSITMKAGLEMMGLNRSTCFLLMFIALGHERNCIYSRIMPYIYIKNT